MTGPCFVDANVFVYAGDRRVPSKQRRAIEWLDLLWREQSGRTSTQALNEAYVALMRIAGAGAREQDAWASVRKYFVWNPAAVDVGLMRLARDIEARYRISWWDSLIVAAAQAQDCTLLLTEDLQDGGVYGSVTVRSPFTLEVREPAADYALNTRIASPHRPRRMVREALAKA
jgi:predicted nucleic acid-binding protein